MPRKTKEELIVFRRDKSVNELISSNKYLRDSKYFKNNSWSWAAWDSWAAQGKAGGCSCCSNRFYNGTLRNKRSSTDRHGKESFLKEVSPHLCYDCIKLIQEKIGTTFQKL